MTTKERRQRDFATREHLFLESARNIIRERGLLDLQMSRVAESCDYAIGTLYLHFASKEDLLIALATDSLQHRADMFRRVAGWHASSRDRMAGIAVADMMFVKVYPEHFRVTQLASTEVIWGAASAERRRMALEASEPLSRIVMGLIEEAVRNGDLQLRGLKPSELALGPWALALGVHTLVHTQGLLEQNQVHEPYRVMMRHLHHLLNDLGWQPLFDPTDSAALEQKITTLQREVFTDVACR